jgi:phospholipase/carboxylesterase
MENKIILEPKIKVPFFVLLHQLGQNESELLFLKDKLPKNSFILSIRGPNDWKTERDDGYGWFDVLGNELHTFSKEDDIEMCSNYINKIIEETIQKYPLLDNPIFIGASQGGVVALHACVDHKIKCNAVVSLLAFYEFKLNNNQLSDTPILMINGELDYVIPYNWVEISKTHLNAKNKNVTGIFLKSGHQITEEMIDISMSWIHKLLQ